LTDAINKHCKSDFDTNTNFKRLSEFIAITRESAQVFGFAEAQWPLD
jgi:hypothetical protein